MILGGFDAFLRRCVRLYAEQCAFRMLCGTRASNKNISVFDSGVRIDAIVYEFT